MAGRIEDRIAGFAERQNSVHPFYHFEPWDVAERPEWMLAQAKADGVDLCSPEMLKHIGSAPHPFQTGYLMSGAFFRALFAGTSIGKAQPHDASVLTPTGFAEMGGLVVGDSVIGMDGLPHKITAIYEQGERPIWKVTFSDGASCECDENHLWRVLTKKRRSPTRHSHGQIESNPYFEQADVMSLRQIMDRQDWRRLGIPLYSPQDVPSPAHTIPAYAMGALLGDGHLGKTSITLTCDKNDEDIIERFGREVRIQSVYSKAGTCAKAYSLGMRYKEELIRLGLFGSRSHNKHIPGEYLVGTEDRINVLRGLMDTDGSTYNGIVEFCSKSETLARQVQWLARSIGGMATLSSSPSSYTKNGVRVDCGTRYRVLLRTTINPFYTRRKADKWRVCRRSKCSESYRTFRSIEYVGKKNARCILVDSDDHTYITNDFIVTHNSYSAMMDAIIMLTGETPVSLRFDAGVDTGVKRAITRDNVLRWGRRDASTGRIIDYNPDAQKSEGWEEWNCGNIMGVGIYPREKIAPPGSEVWLGTFMRALNEYWWPRLTEEARMIIPSHLIDRNRGSNGIDFQQRVVYLVRGGKLACITYDSGFERFEAERVWACILDEEPKDQRIVAAASQHTRFFSLVETPYQGLTYTKKLVFPDEVSPSKAVFHATQYDSPYQQRREIDIKREALTPHEIVARVWGIPSSIKGDPYFDRRKIGVWMQRYVPTHKMARFAPKEQWYGMSRHSANTMNLPSVLDVNVIRSDVSDDNLQNTWYIYEEPQDGVPYIMGVDPAEGAATPDEAGDVSAAGIMRPGEDGPVIVATLRSTLEIIPFSKACAYAMRAYNNATLAAETRRGAASALFYAEMRDWPWWYMHTSMNDATQKPKEHKGFDTNANTRDAIFGLIKDWVDSREEDDYCGIPDYALLKELVEAVKNEKRNMRCDHTKEGTLDSAIWFGILLYIFKHAPEQVRVNGVTAVAAKSKRGVVAAQRAACGLEMLGYRGG